MTTIDPILNVAEIALELRCSKAHAHKIIRGQVTGVSALPSISMGRRVVVRRSAFEAWKCSNERRRQGAILAPSEEHAARRIKETNYA